MGRYKLDLGNQNALAFTLPGSGKIKVVLESGQESYFDPATQKYNTQLDQWIIDELTPQLLHIDRKRRLT